MGQESIRLLVLIVACAAAAAIFLWRISRRSRRLRENYASLAGELQGAVYAGSWLNSPAMSFVHSEMPALLTAANDIVRLDSAVPSLAHSLWHTQLHIGWPDPEARCEIFSRPALWSFLELRPDQFQTGRRAFDGRYVVRGDSLVVLREFLNDEAQTCIQSIRYLGDNNDVYIGLGGGMLTIRKRGVIRELAALQRFTSLGLALFDVALRGPRAQELFARRIGIEFLADQVFFLPHGARCPLCGDAIETDVVYCRACRTPHHAECWRYFGACSTYGCAEEQFTAVVSFRPLRESITIGSAADDSSCAMLAGASSLRSCRRSSSSAKASVGPMR